MNTLLQDESLLIGSREEIQKLATKDSARILVVSDSHGAYSNLLLILRQFGVASDALVFCGDGICDISKLISNAVDEAEIKAIIPPVIGIVEGNNDADLYPVRNVLSEEPYYVQLKVPIFNVLEACGQRIFLRMDTEIPFILELVKLFPRQKKATAKLRFTATLILRLKNLVKFLL